MKQILAAAICAASLACTSGPAATESIYGGVSGSITMASGDDFSFPTIADASTYSYSGTTCSGSAAESSFEVYLSSRAGVCAALDAEAGIASSAALVISIVADPAVSGGAAPVIGAGSYNIGSDQMDPNGNIYDIELVVALFDDSCGQTDYPAVSGTVVITAIDSGAVQGTFSAAFRSDGSSLSGDFNAPTCSVPSANRCSTGTGGCNP